MNVRLLSENLILEELHERFSQAEGLQRERPLLGADGIVYQRHTLGDSGLVGELGLDKGLVQEGAEVGRLIPADGVVVNVHLAQALHHLPLILDDALRVGVLLLLALAPAREREAVGHL